MTVNAQNAPSNSKKADQYNDPDYNYEDYWSGRGYEHQAEVLAIKRLLKGQHFDHAIDLGGGYGRLCTLLAEFADQVALIEPSQKQLSMAASYLSKYPAIHIQQMQANNLKLADGSVDLVLFVRVMHHLPDPKPELAEIARVLVPSGLAIIEVANYLHAQNRLKHLLKGQKFSTEPVDIRTASHDSDEEISFVNHNPHTVIKQLSDAGLSVERVLSVSNLRNASLKKVIPQKLMIKVESVLQPRLATIFFGPSIFFLVRKSG
jgi:SAM-dependent methyltransferase